MLTSVLFERRSHIEPTEGTNYLSLGQSPYAWLTRVPLAAIRSGRLQVSPCDVLLSHCQDAIAAEAGGDPQRIDFCKELISAKELFTV